MNSTKKIGIINAAIFMFIWIKIQSVKKVNFIIRSLSFLTDYFTFTRSWAKEDFCGKLAILGLLSSKK